MNKKTANHFISVYDIENYIKITKKVSTPELFDLMRNIQNITVDAIIKHNPIIIKNLGDSNLMIFNNDDIESKIESLMDLKNKIEEYLKKNGFPEKLSFASHYGEITVGSIGISPYKQTDAFGNEINHAFFMLGKSSVGQFSISQQLYERIDDEFRKIYTEHLFKVDLIDGQIIK